MKNNIIEQDVYKLIEKINFKKINNKSILVTGASGIIGTYILETLYQLDKKFKFKVYFVHKNKIPNHLKKLVKKRNFVSLKYDLSNLKNIKNLPRCDIIFHLAGYGQPLKFLGKKLETITLNTTITMHLLNSLNKNGYFLYGSSSEVYSGINKKSLKEDLVGRIDPYENRSSYIYSKLIGENIVGIFNENGVNAKSARISTAYGPGTKIDDTRVINQLIYKGIKNNVINLLDDGSALRPFCYISDTIEILWRIMFDGKDRVYNVGTPKLTSIIVLAKLIGKELGVKVVVKKNKNALNAPKKVNLNVGRVSKEFEKVNFTKLKDGISKTINWQKDNLF